MRLPRLLWLMAPMALLGLTLHASAQSPQQPAASAKVAAKASGAAVQLNVDTGSTLLPVNTSVLRGYNFGNWMQVSEFSKEMRQVPPAALRFPGGNIGDDEDMSGNKLDFFKLNLELLGKPDADLMVQTRVFQGRGTDSAANGPEDAASAVRFARERGLHVAIWEIGNEPDLFAVTRGDASWTPERYCTVFREQAAAIKREDPQALVAGPAVSGAMPIAPNFARRFIELCGDVVDVVTWHIYPTEGEGPEAKALASASEATRWPQEYRRLLADPKTNPLGHTRPYELGVTEYGLSSRSDRQRLIGQQTGALWAVEFALRTAEAGVRVSHYFAYQGTGFHGLLDNAGAPRPSYYAFSLLAPLEGNFVKATASDDAVWTHGVVKDDRLSVVLINSAVAAKPIMTAVKGWKLVSGRSFDARVAEKEGDFTQLKPAPRVMLAPRAMAVLEYTR